MNFSMESEMRSTQSTLAVGGSLKSMSLSDLLQWVAYGRKTGRLLVERDSLKKFIYFKDGVIVSSSSNNPRESLGHFLVLQKYITEEQLFWGLLKQHKRKKLLGEILVEDGIASEDQIRGTLELKTREAIFDMFFWTEGKFGFYEEEVPEGIKIALSQNVSEIVLEGIKRIDDWTRIREVIPSNSTTFKHTGRAPEGELDELKEAVFRLAGKSYSVGRIALDVNRSDYEVSCLLTDLLAAEVLAVDSTGEEPKTEEMVRQIGVLVKRGDREFKEGHYPEAQKTFAEVLKLDPLNQYAKVYTLKIRNMAAKLKAGESIPRDKIPVVKGDFRTKNLVFAPLEIKVFMGIDGRRDVKSLIAGSSLAEEETLLILKRFLDLDIITFQ
ncbi:MAG: DUF4388 domain-containing protein [Acidobacteriota bacterium]